MPNDLDTAMEELAVTALGVKAERDELRKTEKEYRRRLLEILDLIDGREDIDGNGGPNIFMRIAMTARGEDRP